MTISRRKFISQSSIAGLSLGLCNITDLFAFEDKQNFSYQSDFIKLQLSTQRPQLTYFSTDSLGQAVFKVNPLLLVSESSSNKQYKSLIGKNRVAYYKDKDGIIPDWEITCSEKKIQIRSQWKDGPQTDPFMITLSQKINHSTVLGNTAGKNIVKFPCILHLPGMGTFQVHCSDPEATLWYDACREIGEPFIKLSFAAASATKPDISYTFDSVAIYPESKKIKHDDSRFDGFRRNYINIFQLNPRIQTLANNSASDACTFCLFLYAEMARKTPELVKGLTAMDLIRDSCDQYFSGMLGYGQVGYKVTGWNSKFDSSDSAPSVIISACYYILDTRDYDWARKNYDNIKAWATKMIETDHNHNGLVEYGYSGNSGSWRKEFKRPSNWWDTIGFGYEDAYSNALVFRALNLLAEVSGKLDKKTDRDDFAAFAAKLKSNYYQNFYHPETGLLAGWKSEDGNLHDYYFTFVNSVAICYGLVEKDQAIAIMKVLLVKMKEVGYTNFALGLPGNLIPIRDEDYTAADRRWGWGKDAEGKDGFQIYENGGATGCYAYFTIKALLNLNMRHEAEMILMPMLESYKNGDFEGHCPESEMTKDWKTWSGECWGYEGFLVDNYLTFLAVTDL